MNSDFWRTKWDNGEIGFHQEEVHPWLKTYWSAVAHRRDDRVLVPLCGKSLDLRFLAGAGHPVVGVELVEQAVRAFFEEWEKEPSEEEADGFLKLQATQVALYCGDFFGFAAEEGPFQAWYDRAAFVALPPQLRAPYAQRILELTAPGSRGLLIGFDYPPEEQAGPPFATSRREVEQFFGKDWHVEQLAFEDLTETEHNESRGLSRMTRGAYLLERR